LPTSNAFRGGVAYMLTALCLWLVPAVLPVSASPPGTVVAWGYNEDGQTTIPAELGGSVTAIAAGNIHTVVLKDDATVVVLGGAYAPVPIGLNGVTAIAAGDAHTVALKTDGAVVAWGYNNRGQTTVPAAGFSGVMAIAAGYWHTVALKTNGSVVAWGDNRDGQTSIPAAGLSGVMAIAAGVSHTVALKTNGTVVAWGYSIAPPAGLSEVRAIAAGGYNTVALKSDGTVVAWGGSYGESDVPIGLAGVQAIAAGYHHTVALQSNGTMVAWGYNGFGQTNVPTELGGVIAIAAGVGHTAAIAMVTPSITVQPVSRTVNVGENVAFSVTASGTAPLNYQWRKGAVVTGFDIPGATNTSYALTNARTQDAGAYSVLITNAAGRVRSSMAVLTVSVSNNPPSVSLANPGNGAAFAAPANIVVTANAADADGTVSAVRFYVGTNVVGLVTNAPFSITWSNIPSGNFSLTATAIDNQGATGSSLPATFIAPTLIPRPPCASALLVEEVMGRLLFRFRVLKTSGVLSNAPPTSRAVVETGWQWPPTL
jgi:hypothetical protein